MVDAPSAAADLPQWLSYAAGAAGIIISAVVVRLGWASRGEAPETSEQGRLMGAIVDSGSIRDLTLAIQANTEVGKAGAEAIEESGRELRSEIRNLGDEVRRLANKIEK